jgi:hypothetical protein
MENLNLQAINIVIHRFIHSLWITTEETAPKGGGGAVMEVLQAL